MVEDPTQLSKHGKPMVAPIIYPLEAGQESNPSSTTVSRISSRITSPEPSPEFLRQTAARETDGQGVFMTLAVPTHDTPKKVKKSAAQQRRKLRVHLEQLQYATTQLTPRYFVTPQIALGTRWLNLMGLRPIEEQPFSILGSWVDSIPLRIGKSPAVDLAVEYLIDSFAVHQEPSLTARRTALATKAKALEALQLSVGNEATRRSYDTAMATKMHFMAEVCLLSRIAILG